MERVPPGGLEVEAVENVLVVPDIMERPELRRVQKTAAADSVHGEKVAEFGGAVPQPKVAFSLSVPNERRA